jgi:hypothetical protein
VAYKPQPGFEGSDTFKYRGTNGAGGGAIGTVTAAAPLGTGVSPGFRAGSGLTAPGSVNNTVCLENSGNSSAGESGVQGIGLRKQGTVPTTHTFGIEGLSPAPAGSPNVENCVNSQNPAGGGSRLISATSEFTSCSAP